MIDDAKYEVFRENHATLSYHLAALMIAVRQQRETEHQVALGMLGNAGTQKTQVAYHTSKIKALAASM